MKTRILIAAFLLLLGGNLFAFNEQNVKVRSAKMNKDIAVNIILPDHYDALKSYPVVYLLHGYGGNHLVWSQQGVVGALADQYQFIVVMPDGGWDSWYFDSPVTPEYQYETFVSQELVAHVDSTYSTLADRKGRAITGLSMGGHGALYLAFKHQDVFGIVGSLSGGVDIRPFPNNWGIKSRLGTIEEYPERWEQNTIVNMTHLLKPGSLDITFECGSDDFFYKVNCDLHHKLLNEGIAHDFYSRPGSHNWTYWLNGIQYQFLFFKGCFVQRTS